MKALLIPVDGRLLGPVVIVGLDKDTAEPAALSPAQARAILEKIRAQPA